LKDNGGNLWAGADRGLSTYNYETEKFTSVVSGFVIFSLLEDSNGRFWAGTMSHGLVRVDRETGAWSIFRDEHPLGGCKINQILEDVDGFLWVATSQGLVKFNPADQSVMVIDAANGLPGSEYLTAGIVKPDGQILWGTSNNGLIMFHPKEIR
jgi:ligand-binding sensor domain-containing protein